MPESSTRKKTKKPARSRYQKSLEGYYVTLKDYARQYAFHEGAISTTFQTVLADATRLNHWTLIPQLTAKTIADRIGQRSSGLLGSIE